MPEKPSPPTRQYSHSYANMIPNRRKSNNDTFGPSTFNDNGMRSWLVLICLFWIIFDFFFGQVIIYQLSHLPQLSLVGMDFHKTTKVCFLST